MFERKLAALDYHSPNSFDFQDEKVFRNFISWLENQKIRLYKVDERFDLDRIDDQNWPQAFEKYLTDLELNNLTINTERKILIEQLMSHAIRLEYSDNLDKYNTLNAHEYSCQDKSQTRPLENFDYNSQEFVNGLHRMQRLLNLPSKLNDNTSVLQAMSKLIYDKLRPEALEQLNDSLKEQQKNSKNANENNNVQINLGSINLGFDTSDNVLNEAAKVLRLLHIQELRDLQTKINEAIVSLQTITANPKTDSSLGRVGK